MTGDLRIGSMLGSYRIIALLGRGGMGVVYRAEHVHLDRAVALKVLGPDLGDDPSFRERFVGESKTAAGLEHPNVIPVYDAGEVDGTLFIAMRIVRGSDLAEVLRREGALSTARTLAVLSNVAAALDEAHLHGLVHRDVKPANVLLEARDRGAEHVYLSDLA